MIGDVSGMWKRSLDTFEIETSWAHDATPRTDPWKRSLDTLKVETWRAAAS